MEWKLEVTIMLRQFTVKNFKSIRDEATFDMQAATISELKIGLSRIKMVSCICRCQLFTDRMVVENQL